MSDEKITIQQWVKNYKAGMYARKDRDTMCDAGWYDWFCTEGSLHRRMNKMASMVIAVSESPLLGKQPQYIFFKNNCPMRGELYDSFSVCNISDGEVQWWITAKTGYKNHEAADVCYRYRGFDTNIIREYARLKNDRLTPDKQEIAVRKMLAGGVPTIKKFFSNEDLTLKQRIIFNQIPQNYLSV